ncbi:MAG TPA: phospholipid carrier-dependent glycosyltransferase, partial [Gemmataceae bacterium]|nr:phospholipid carrier-dependent glycosyltransferase [Gemmataceae bacterium]
MLSMSPARAVASARSFLVSRRRELTIVGLLWAAVVVQTGWFRRSSSVTVDETFYLSVSLRSLRQGALDRQFIRAGSAPLPMILNYFPLLFGDRAALAQDRSNPWSGMPGDARLIAGPRLLNTLTSLVPLVGVVFFWLRARRGLAAATFAAAVLAFSPSLLAHASLATTDMTFAFHVTLAVLVMGEYLRAPDRWRLLAVALTTSLAVSSKYTGILLVPCFLLALAVRSRLRGLRPAIGFCVLTLILTWALHGFQVGGNGRLVRFPAGRTTVKVNPPGFVNAIRIQLRHNRGGHPAFLMGMRSPDGWWSYFPVTVVLKSTGPELLLVLSA